jgi:hypothetical protein
LERSIRLAHESLICHQGFHGIDGLCHVRVFEQDGRLPVVIAGELDDNPGSSVTSAIEMVAAAVKEEVLPEGREFELIEHYSYSLDASSEPSFERVRFAHADPDQDPPCAGTVAVTDCREAALLDGPVVLDDFRSPRWEPVADIEELVGCEVRVWPTGRYTAQAVAGDEGERRRADLAARAREARDQLIALLRVASTCRTLDSPDGSSTR